MENRFNLEEIHKKEIGKGLELKILGFMYKILLYGSLLSMILDYIKYKATFFLFVGLISLIMDRLIKENKLILIVIKIFIISFMLSYVLEYLKEIYGIGYVIIC